MNSMNLPIRYEGFAVVAMSRLYKFTVNAFGDEPRHFTVSISPELFVSAQLKFQDGPAISFQRLRKELEIEAENSPATTQFCIDGHDIESFLLAQHPKSAKKKRLQLLALSDQAGLE